MNRKETYDTNFVEHQSLAGIAAIALAGSVSTFAESPNLDGRWAATMTQKGGTVIPFRLDISGTRRSRGGHAA